MDEALVVKEYRPRVLYYVLKQVRDRALAEEITQEALLIVIQALRQKRVREQSKLGSYLFGVSRNLILKHYGKQPPEGLSEDLQNQTMPWMRDPEAALLLRERHAHLQEAFSRLKPQEREILARSVLEAENLEDIARTMETPYAATRKRKSRAMDRLKNIFLDLSQKRHS
jgi:RNA polymerase sigma factor (sigma-70 family)